MCDMLGTEPIEEEIPIEWSDLGELSQTTLTIYQFLADNWEGFNGVYLGKHFNGVSELFDIFEVPRDLRQTIMSMLKILDNAVISTLTAKRGK